MPKKGKRPGKNQRTRLKARKQRLEMAETLGDQNKPTQRVHVDEKGRRLTVVLGGELVSLPSRMTRILFVERV